MIKKLKLFAALALLAPILALAQTIVISLPAQVNGPTITFTAAVAGSLPVPVQATSTPGSAYTQQYVITNNGANTAFVSSGTSAAIATTNCVIPAGTATLTIPMLPLSQSTITAPPNLFFCGITATSTSAIFVTPVIGE